MTAEEKLKELYERGETASTPFERVKYTKEAEAIDLIADLVVERLEDRNKVGKIG